MRHIPNDAWHIVPQHVALPSNHPLPVRAVLNFQTSPARSARISAFQRLNTFGLSATMAFTVSRNADDESRLPTTAGQPSRQPSVDTHVKNHFGKIVVACIGLTARALAANAPDALSDVVYHEHFRETYDPGDEYTALRSDGTAFSYLRFQAGRFTTPVPPGGAGSFAYAKTGPSTAELSITDEAGRRVTRTLVFVTDTSGTWSTALLPPGHPGTEQTFSLRPLYPPFPLMNSSSRASIGPGQRTIFGFVVSGETRQVLVRTVGPGLQAFGVSAFAPTPVLELFSSDGVRLATQTGWDKNPADNIPLAPIFQVVGAFPLSPGSADAATLFLLRPGNYSVHASTSGAAGEVLIEVYVLP
jgi:hypothetical protein